MTIKYCDITIIRNLEEDSLFNNMQRWFGYDTTISENSDIIILFEDETIYDVKQNLKDYNFKYLIPYYDLIPSYFERKNKINTYFNKDPFMKNGVKTLDFTQIFKSSESFKKNKRIASSYNCIYYCHKNYDKPEVLSILRIYSSEDKPRFILAYDSEEFNKDEIIYLINTIFKNKYNYVYSNNNKD